MARHDSAVGKVINVGTGGDISVKQIAQLVFDLIGKELPIEEDPQRLRPARSEIPRLVCNYGLAEDLLGWEPSYSLEEGLGETISWMRDRLGDFKTDRYNV